MESLILAISISLSLLKIPNPNVWLTLPSCNTCKASGSRELLFIASKKEPNVEL